MPFALLTIFPTSGRWSRAKAFKRAVVALAGRAAPPRGLAIGENLRAHREQAGLTVAQLAAESGVKASQIAGTRLAGARNGSPRAGSRRPSA